MNFLFCHFLNRRNFLYFLLKNNQNYESHFFAEFHLLRMKNENYLHFRYEQSLSNQSY